MLELRMFNDEDVSLAEMWLNEKHVRKWYDAERSRYIIQNPKYAKC